VVVEVVGFPSLDFECWLVIDTVDKDDAEDEGGAGDDKVRVGEEGEVQGAFHFDVI
jgi:hypothetical protein